MYLFRILASSFFLYKNMFYLSGCIGCYIYGALLVNFQPDVLNPLLLICSVFTVQVAKLAC